jgi:hypothetical protein
MGDKKGGMEEKNHNFFRDIYFQFSSCHFLLFALFETHKQEHAAP